MIIDAFPFFAETDVLDIRLNELKDVVDYFIIVEADQTHKGKPKEFNFPKIASKYDNIKDKIIYKQISFTQVTNWGRENEQRIRLADFVKDLAPKDDDLIFVSDCDEIWNKEKLNEIRGSNRDFGFLNQMFFVHFINCWSQKCVTGSGFLTGKFFNQEIGAKPNLFQLLRNAKDVPPAIHDGGWHYSYLGDAKHLAQKSLSIADGSDNPNDKTTETYFKEVIRRAIEDKKSEYTPLDLRFFNFNLHFPVQLLSYITPILQQNQIIWPQKVNYYKIKPDSLNSNYKFYHKG